MNSLQFNLARIVGPAIAGQLIAIAGPQYVFGLNTLSFLGVLFAVSRTCPAPASRSGPSSAASDLLEALRFVFTRRGPMLVIIAVSVFALLAVPMRHQIPIFVRNVYSFDEKAFGILLAVMGAGAVTGGLLLQLIPTHFPRRRLIPVCMIGAGLSIVGFAMADSIWLAAPLLFLAGLFWLGTFSSCWSAIQLLVPDAMRGRVMSINTTVMFAMMAAGNLLVGYSGSMIGGKAGPQLAVGGAAALLVVIGTVMLIVAPREVDA